MNVLSLFDGMSCGRIALERAGIKVDNYFASEVDKHAIKVSKANYPDIIHIGDVTKIDVKSLPKIDLLIGGSPCQGFSMAGKQLAFDDPRSFLYFEYERILKELQEINPNLKFLLENVKMKKEYKDVITSRLGVEPIAINSNLLSAQNRLRLYWANFNIQAVERQEIRINTILDKSTDQKLILSGEGLNKVNKKRSRVIDITSSNKTPCLLANQGKKSTDAIVFHDGLCYRYPSKLEMERLQTVPEGYTETITYSEAARVLGNGWTVDVIAHIFKGLKEEE